jgi:hypothetical protein
MERKIYISAFKKLKDWALKEGFKSVSIGHNNISYVSWEKDSLNTPCKIKIQSGYDSEHRVYLLLHELGHHQLRKDWDWFTENFPVLARAEVHHHKKKGNNLKRRKDYQMYSLEEEFRAWDEGFNLAYAMDIPIDLVKWNALRTKCLMGYFNNYCSK